MSAKNVTLKEKINGAAGNVLFPATTTPNVYDSAKSQALSQTLVNTPGYEALGFAKFSTATAYNTGDKVYKDNGLYRFIADKTAGEWDVAKVEPWSIEQEIEEVEDGIRSLIPAQASADNKLADKAYVNDKVSTDTATFRGTFNLVTDLELTTEATQGQIATALGTAISGEDKNDYAFVQIPTSDATPTEIARIDRYKYTGLQWSFEYSLNNSGFTAEQWAAINSGITSSLVTAFGAKYDKPAGGIPASDMNTSTFDDEPTANSDNLVKSGGIAREFLKLTGQENRNAVSNLTISGGIDTSGEELNNSTATTSFKRSDFILVYKGSVINYGLRTPTSYLMIALYNSDKEFVSGIEGTNRYKQGSLNIDIDGYIKISCRNTEINNNAAVANIVYDGEIKKGDKENAEKISELNLYNKNKYNDITNILIEQGCVDSNGEKVNRSTVANYHRSVLLKVYKGISIIYNNLRTPAGYNMISLYNDSGQYIEGIEGIGAITSGRYIPSSDGYICVSSRDNEVSAGYSSIYIEGTEYITKKVYDGELVDSSILYLNNKKQYLNILQNYKRMPRTGSAESTLVPFSLTFFSDIHGSKVNLGRIIEFTTEYADLLDDTLCGGDLQSGVWTDGIAFWTGTPDANKILITIGNHDVYGETPQDREPRADVYQRFIGDFISNWGNVVQPANAATNSLCYYYKDYSDSKIRLVVLDSMYYDSEQENWLISVLNDAKTNELSVVISSHYAPDQIVGLNTSFQTLQQMSALTTLPISAAAAVQAFIGDGGKFVCWLTGHLHNDMFGYSQTYNNQLILVIGCATSKASQNASNDIARVDGTKSMDEFDIINIDSYNKTLKILRVGADKDSFGRSRFSASVNYETKAVLWND